MYEELLEDRKVKDDFKIERLVKISDALKSKFYTYDGDLLTGDTIYADQEKQIVGMMFSEYLKLREEKDNGLNWASPGDIKIGNKTKEYIFSTIAAVGLEIGDAYSIYMNKVHVANTLSFKGTYFQGFDIRNVRAKHLNFGKSRHSFGNEQKSDYSFFAGRELIYIEGMHIDEILCINKPVMKSSLHIGDLEVGKGAYFGFDETYGAQGVDIKGTFHGDVEVDGKVKKNLDFSRSKFGGKLTVGDLTVEGDVNFTNVKGLDTTNLILQGTIDVKGGYYGPAHLKPYFKK